MPKEHAENIWRHATENDLFCVAFSHPKGHPELRNRNKFFKAIREALGEDVVQRIADTIGLQQSPAHGAIADS
jgi:transcriptional regulator of met regulon